jgi:hypothetical protein
MHLHKTILFLFVCSISLYSCKKEQGCTDITACNFSTSAEENDGSCFSPGDECDDNNPNTYNDLLDNNCNCEGTEGSPQNSGCMDSSACNYSASSTEDDGSCLYTGDPCNDNNSSTINDTINSNCDCVGNTSESGCMDSSACNYNAGASEDNGSCLFTGDPCNDNNSNTIYDEINSNCDCVGTTSVSGCLDSAACNYNSNANTYDNSCVYPGDECDDGDANTTNDILNNSCDCVGTPTGSDYCALDAEGQVPVTFGVYTDNYESECQYRIHLTSDESITTDWIIPTVANANNEATWYFTGYEWTMQVEDSDGDGKGDNGYYYATCLSNTGDVITLVNTPFTTGYTSSTDFIIGSGIANPSVSDIN